MFSNVSPQSHPLPGQSLIGFASLAEYDKPAHGGNGDGVIDSHDSIFARLNLWRDLNHNGISEATELFTLQTAGVESISLDYKLSRRTDRWGNVFRYRAKVYGTNHSDLGRWAYDVILQSAKPSLPMQSIARIRAGGFGFSQDDLFVSSDSRRLGEILNARDEGSFLRAISREPVLLR